VVCSRLEMGDALVATLISVVLLSGCDGAASGRRATKPVTVTVTYKGAPVADATVTFISQEGEPSAAYGTTDSAGAAKLKTYEEGDGAVLGKQKVTINKEQIVGEKPVADQESPDYVPPPGTTPPPQVKHLIPPKYSGPDTSPLTADVTSSGPNEFKFELTD
jgi:hypothetical protein